MFTEQTVSTSEPSSLPLMPVLGLSVWLHPRLSTAGACHRVQEAVICPSVFSLGYSDPQCPPGFAGYCVVGVALAHLTHMLTFLLTGQDDVRMGYSNPFDLEEKLLKFATASGKPAVPLGSPYGADFVGDSRPLGTKCTSRPPRQNYPRPRWIHTSDLRTTSSP